MSQKVIIESLSMDLLRVALGLHRGSFKMAERFKEEALKRQNELDLQFAPTYLQKLFIKSKYILEEDNPDNAEDFLMYSILFQNAARKYYS